MAQEYKFGHIDSEVQSSFTPGNQPSVLENLGFFCNLKWTPHCHSKVSMEIII